MRVIHTPGHAGGQIALYYEKEQALFSADCVPVPGEIPIYEDVMASLKSIEKLQQIKGLKVLLPAWDEPQHSDQVYETFNKGRSYIQRVHAAVLKALGTLKSDDTLAIAKSVVQELGLPAASLNPIFLKVIEAHLKLRDQKDLLRA